MFQKKQFHLGKFERIEDAAEARKAAEELIFDGSAKHYQLWKERAEADPQCTYYKHFGSQLFTQGLVPILAFK